MSEFKMLAGPIGLGILLLSLGISIFTVIQIFSVILPDYNDLSTVVILFVSVLLALMINDVLLIWMYMIGTWRNMGEWKLFVSEQNLLLKIIKLIFFKLRW